MANRMRRVPISASRLIAPLDRPVRHAPGARHTNPPLRSLLRPVQQARPSLAARTMGCKRPCATPRRRPSSRLVKRLTLTNCHQRQVSQGARSPLHHGAFSESPDALRIEQRTSSSTRAGRQPLKPLANTLARSSSIDATRPRSVAGHPSGVARTRLVCNCASLSRNPHLRQLAEAGWTHRPLPR